MRHTNGQMACRCDCSPSVPDENSIRMPRKVSQRDNEIEAAQTFDARAGPLGQPLNFPHLIPVFGRVRHVTHERSDGLLS